MPSTYTANNGLEKIATGEQSGTYGTTWQTTLDLIDAAVDGSVNIALSSSTYALNIANGTASNGRNKIIIFTGSPGATCTVTVTPSTAKKLYFVVNNTNQSVIIAQGSGSTVTIPLSQARIVYCDGAGAGAAVSLAAPLNTDQVEEGSRQYFTTARGRAVFFAGSPFAYNSTTGILTIQTAGALQSGVLSFADWGTFFTKEPGISPGTTAQYWRGDKTWATLSTDVAAGARAAISVTGNGSYNPSTGVITINTGAGVAWGTVSGSLSAQTDLQSELDAKAAASTLTSHTGNTSNPHSVTKTQVGLSAVPNTDCTNATNITSGTLAAVRMAALTGDSGAGGVQGAAPAPAAGDAAAGKFLKADGTWALPGGGMKSVQRGSRSFASVSNSRDAAAVTITSVTTSKSFVTVTASWDASPTPTLAAIEHSAKLTSSTQLDLVVSSTGAGTITVEWEVVEFN